MPHLILIDPATATPAQPKSQRSSQRQHAEDGSEVALRRTRVAAAPFQQAKLVLALWRGRIRARRKLRELCSLSDRVLDDIGLVRGQLLLEASKPFWR